MPPTSSRLAFELPAGEHRVDVVYRPRAFELGLLVSTATALLLAGLASMLVWQSRR